VSIFIRHIRKHSHLLLTIHTFPFQFFLFLFSLLPDGALVGATMDLSCLDEAQSTEAAASAGSSSGRHNQLTRGKRSNLTQRARKQHEKKRIVALKQKNSSTEALEKH